MNDTRQDDWWQTFKKTGRIADYLRYRGIDVYQNPTASVGGKEAPHAADDRRAHHPDISDHR